jgi:hypothetical protein
MEVRWGREALFGDTAEQGQGFCQGRGTRVEVAERGGGKKLPADQFHGSLPEEALVLLKQRVT